MRHPALLILALVPLLSFPARSGAVTISTAAVDGVCNNDEAVITGRSPVFSWEWNSARDYATYQLTVWKDSDVFCSITESTSPANTGETADGYETKRAFEALFTTKTLSSGITYDWSVSVWDDLGLATATAAGQFTAVSMGVSLAPAPADLKVDGNNPLFSGKPAKFRYSVTSASLVKVRIYTLSGEYVATVAEHSAYRDIIYTAQWDGTDGAGRPVDAGIYLVNLWFDQPRGITRKVAVERN